MAALNHRLLGKESTLYSGYSFRKYLLSVCHGPGIVLGCTRTARNNPIKIASLIKLMVTVASPVYSVPGAVPCSVHITHFILSNNTMRQAYSYPQFAFEESKAWRVQVTCQGPPGWQRAGLGSLTLLCPLTSKSSFSCPTHVIWAFQWFSNSYTQIIGNVESCWSLWLWFQPWERVFEFDNQGTKHVLGLLTQVPIKLRNWV